MPKPAGQKKWKHRIGNPGEVGAGSTAADGKYRAKIVAAEMKESAEGNDYIAAQWKILGPKYKGAIVYDNFSLQDQALWKIRNLFTATDREWPSKAFDLGPDDFLDYEAVIEIVNEKYEGRDRPRVSPQYLTADTEIEGEDEDAEEEDSEEEDEEEEKPTKKKKSSKAKDEEEEEEEEESEDEEEEEEEEEEKKPTKKKKSSGSSSKLKVGSKVKFKDDDGKTVKGVITKIDDETATVEDSDDESWEVPVEELTAV